MVHPAHPTSERAAAKFHGALWLVGLTHVIGGVAMMWFHAIAAKKHWADR
jgi:hypothetical protein